MCLYNSEHTLQELYTRLEKVFRETIKEEFELILVDDGSRDRSFAVMQELREKDPRVKIIQMARNFGQHPALLCGFAHAKGEFIVTMDDDLQHQPEELPKMINVMKERDDVDVIIASYEGRKHNLIRKLGTKLSVWATSKMLGKDPNLQITSYRLIRRFLVEAMLKTNTYLPQIGNLLVLSSNRIINVPVQHAARAYGKSGYSFRRLVKDLIYDITAHTAFPLLGAKHRHCQFSGKLFTGDLLSGEIFSVRDLSGRLDISDACDAGIFRTDIAFNRDHRYLSHEYSQ